jgi:hypothetical protein
VDFIKMIRKYNRLVPLERKRIGAAMFDIPDEHEAPALIKAAGESTCSQQEDDAPIDPYLGLFVCIVFGIGALVGYGFLFFGGI